MNYNIIIGNKYYYCIIVQFRTVSNYISTPFHVKTLFIKDMNVYNKMKMREITMKKKYFYIAVQKISKSVTTFVIKDLFRFNFY